MTEYRNPDEPCLRKPTEVIGKNLRFRNAALADAEFILQLRLDPSKNAFLSQTSPDLSEQRNWLKRYASDHNQVYFIIETLLGDPVGTVRLYDRVGPSFCWGSWILNDHAPKSAAVESTLMVYLFALELGFTRAHFDVRKANVRVWTYHERFGAERVGEDEDNYYYEISGENIARSIENYKSRLPDGVAIHW